MNTTKQPLLFSNTTVSKEAYEEIKLSLSDETDEGWERARIKNEQEESEAARQKSETELKREAALSRLERLSKGLK